MSYTNSINMFPGMPYRAAWEFREFYERRFLHMGLLDLVEKQTKRPARKVVIHAPDKFGKSSFAIKFPKPLILDFAGDVDDLCAINNIPRIKISSLTGNEPTSFYSVVDEILADPGKIETIVVDTLTVLERRIFQIVCKTMNVDSLSEVDFGKGIDAAQPIFDEVLDTLDRVTASGLHVVLVCHQTTEKVDLAHKEPYQRLGPAVHPKHHLDALCQWASEILCGVYSLRVKKGKHDKVGKVIGDDQDRSFITGGTLSARSGRRINLPDEFEIKDLPSDWDVFAEALK